MRGAASSRCVRPLLPVLLGALLLSPIFSARAQNEEPVKIDRYLVNLTLGDTMDEIQKVYPPASEWPMTVAGKKKIKRYRVDRTSTKYPAPNVDTLWLGLRHGQLVEVQLIYTAAHTRKKPVDALAQDLALTYGAPHSDGGKYWWVDGRTVMRVFSAEVPGKDGGVELRTSLQLAEKKLFPKRD